MKPFNPESEPIAQKQERVPSHLKEGVPPIMACVGTPDEFRAHPRAEKLAFYEDASYMPGARNVDYYGNPRDLQREKIKNSGKNSYVISPLDTLDKFSKSFYNCTGVVVTGYDKKAGKNISFLSHEDPNYFLRRDNDFDFITALKESLVEVKTRCAEGTIDAAIVGGKYPTSDDIKEAPKLRTEYLASIKFLSDEVSDVLGFEPVVIAGPKLVEGGDIVFYENKNRRLYISRPDTGDSSTESFNPSDLEKQKGKW